MGGVGPGGVFAGFRIVRELGAGGMGRVFLARDRDLPRYIALKVLNDEAGRDAELRARFLREADIVARLDHPNIVTVHARGTERGQLWIAMGYVDGTDVEKALRGGALDPARAVRILTATADALDCAHDARVLHRDVKPANILLTSGPRERVVLTDFGIAKPLDELTSLTQTGKVLASFHYAAPERLYGNASSDPASDVYSLGCTVFHILTGRTPFAGANFPQLIYAHSYTPPPPPSTVNPALPREVDAVIARALAKDPADRYPTCGALATALAAAFAPPARSHNPPAAPHNPPATAADVCTPAPPAPTLLNPAAAGTVPAGPTPGRAAATPSSASPIPGPANRIHKADTASPAAREVAVQPLGDDRGPAAQAGPAQPAASTPAATPPMSRIAAPPGQSLAAPSSASLIPSPANRIHNADAAPPAASGDAARPHGVTRTPRAAEDPADALHGRPAAAPNADLSSAAVVIGAAAEEQSIAADTPESGSGLAATHVVDPAGPLATVAAAIARASAGDIIAIRPGTYRESLRIDKAITLIGRGERDAVVIACDEGHTVVCTAAGASLENLTVIQDGIGSGRTAVDIGAGAPSVVGCAIRSSAGPCVAVHDDGDPTLRRNIIRDGSAEGISVFDGGRGTYELNLLHNLHTGVRIGSGAAPVLRENTIRDITQFGVLVEGEGTTGLLERNELHGAQNWREHAAVPLTVRAGADPVVRDNTVRAGDYIGVRITDGARGLLADNRIEYGDGAGDSDWPAVCLESGAGVTLRGNTIADPRERRNGRPEGVAGAPFGVIYIADETTTGLLDRNTVRAHLDAVAVVVKYGANPALRDNDIRGGSTGVLVGDTGTTGLLDHNTLGGHDCAISVLSGADPTIRGNTIRDNSIGIDLLEGNPMIESNVLTGNRAAAVRVYRHANPALRRNMIRDNPGNGIRIATGGRGVFTANTLTGHDHEPAIHLEPGAEFALGDNVLRDNAAGDIHRS